MDQNTEEYFYCQLRQERHRYCMSIAAALENAYGLRVETHHYPNTYTVYTVFSPTNLPVISFGFIEDRFLGASSDIDSKTVMELTQMPIDK